MPREAEAEVRVTITREGVEALNDHFAVLGRPLVRVPWERSPAFPPAPRPPSLPRRCRAVRRRP